MKKLRHKDFPKCHMFLAGDAYANSGVGINWYNNRMRNVPVHAHELPIYQAAEAYFVETKLTDEELFEAGYETNCGLMLNLEGTCTTDVCIGDLPNEQIAAEWKRLYAKYKLDYDKVEDLINSTY